MKTERTEVEMHLGGRLIRGLAGLATGTILLLLAVNGTWAHAQASAQPTTPGSAADARGLPTHPAVPDSTTGIVGTWQGTLHIPKTDQHPQIDLRLVFKISKTDAGALKAIWYSIDQGGQPAPIATVDFRDGVMKFTVTVVPRSYEGTMSEDGKSIVGTWMEDKTPIPMVLERATPDSAWPIPEPPKPMAADAKPSFEVATIKPSDPNRPGRAFLWRGNRFLTIDTTLMSLIGFAYDVHGKQVIGGEDWMSSEKFDIEAKPDTPGVPSVEQMRTMLQKLLADRFQLKFHSDKRELSAYVLTSGKTEPKMTKDDTDPNGLPGLFFRQLGDLNVHNATMADFAHLMQSAVLDRPVVDETELAGKWDFELKWTPDDSQFGPMGMRPPPPSDAADAPPPLFTAIQEQLGLKLESEKAQVDVMVIDHVEKPSPN
jgi:uncharacterized protein (TIGR03435 family)